MTDHPLPDDFSDPLHAQPPHSPQEDWQQVSPYLEKLLNAARPYRGAIEACAKEATRREQKQRLLKIANDLSDNRLADEVFDYGRDMDPSRIEALQWHTSDRQSPLDKDRSARFSSPPKRSAGADQVVWNTVAYPAFTLLAMLLLALLMWSTFIPEFQQIFDDFALPLPPPTVLILSLRPFIVAATVACAAVLLIWPLRNRLFTRKFRSWLSFKVPVVGHIYRNAAYGKYCHLVSILLKAGAPLAPTMRVASRGTLPQQAAKAVDHLAATRSRLAPPKSARFPNRLFLAMQSRLSDQDKGALLRELSHDLYGRASSRAKHYLQPLMILGVGLMVGFVVTGLFMPLVSLITNLSG